MITEDYVSFETAKLLKEKGFNEPTNEFFDGQKICGGIPDFGECCWNEDPFVRMGFPKFKTFAKPPIAKVMKWLREVHNCHICMQALITTDGLQGYCPFYTKVGGVFMWQNVLGDDYATAPTYEEACEAAIKYCLENLI